jgi:deoxyribonuclease-1
VPPTSRSGPARPVQSRRGGLHNLWPAPISLNSARGKRPLAEIDGDEIREVDIHGRIVKCEFQMDGDFVEPRRIVRDNLARSIFYMCAEYGFPVDADVMATLRKWIRDDPPTQAERSRAEKIRLVQGTRNKFIAIPALGDGLQCGTPAPPPAHRPPQAPG